MMFENIADSTEVSLLQSVHPPGPIALPFLKTHRYPGSGTANINCQRALIEQTKPNIVKSLRITDKIAVENIFIRNLKEKCLRNDWIIVSIWGPEKSGQSFLVDVVFSLISKKVTREMTKANNEGINSYFFQSQSPSQKSIIFLDWSGFGQIITQTDQNIFSLMYMISSVILFNRRLVDHESENRFRYLCQKLPEKLKLNNVEISIPKLILLSRDSDINQSSLEQQLHKLELFSPDIASLQFDKPFEECSHLQDIPQSILNSGFLQPVKCLISIINSADIKLINDMRLIQNMDVLFPFTVDQINKYNSIDIDSIWMFLVEFRRVEYYNHFVVYYQQILDTQLADDSCFDTYEMFLMLKSVSTKTYRYFKKVYQKQFQDVTNFSPMQPLYTKIKAFVASKEKKITQMNFQKKKQATTKFQQKIMERVSLDKSKSNASDFIYQISNIDGKVDKLEILFSVMSTVMSNTNIEIKTMSTSKKSLSMSDLKCTLRQINSDIDNQKNRINQLKANTQMLGSLPPSQSLKNKQEYFKRVVEETYYMNKAFWQLKRERQSARDTEMKKVQEYYDVIIMNQESEMANLRDYTSGKREKDRQETKERIARREREVKFKTLEVQNLKMDLKRSKKRWLCCW